VLTAKVATTAALVVTLAACSTPHSSPPVAAHTLRVVALVPSFVEDLCAIGASGQLVGVSDFTEDVPCARGLPIVGDFASIDGEKVVALRPDLVVGLPSQERSIAPLRRAHVRVETMRDLSYGDLFDNIRQLGALTGRAPAADALIASLQSKTQQIQTRAAAFKRHPRVFVALGTGPIFTAGSNSYIATLIALAGGHNAVGVLPGAYAAYSAEALLRLQPDAIVTDKAVALTSVLGREPWHSLRAVQHNEVWVLPDAAILERPGPRYNEGLEWLVNRLTPLAK
jgi:ABC-type Fe3+-hydroxamate transport system substrate-binding protein